MRVFSFDLAEVGLEVDDTGLVFGFLDDIDIIEVNDGEGRWW